MSKIDISAHFLVPKHELLSEKEVKELLEKYSISKENLPKIKHNDPAISKLKAKPGDVIRITRKSDFVGETYYYRLVE